MTATRTRLVDVANAAGVSTATASHVLSGGSSSVRVSEGTAARVRLAAEKLAYRPNPAARQLHGKGSKTIGVLLDPYGAPNTPQALLELESLAHAHGYRLLIAHPQNDARRLQKTIDDFTDRGIDGLICLHHNYPDTPELVPRQAQRIGKTVFLGKPALDGLAYVAPDVPEATRVMLRHVVERGSMRPAMLLPDMLWEGSFWKRDAYLDELGHLLPEAKPRIWLGGLSPGDVPHYINQAKAWEAIEELVVRQQADALLCYSDYWAAAFIQRLKGLGRCIPQDVRIISNNNLPFAALLDPPLTCVDIGLAEVGRRLFRFMLALIEDRDPYEKEQSPVTPELVVRGST